MGKTIDEVRRDAEDIPETTCMRHMRTFRGLICTDCQNEQTVRVERESLPLRLAETTSAQRAWVLKTLAERNNGKSH